MPSLTVHTIIKNEDRFIAYALKSVVDYADKIIIFDTGSEDGTVGIVRDFISRYPDKILFEEKGPCDKVRHTALRQEMIDRTTTDWFMILDGDEVWTDQGMKEAVGVIARAADQGIECLVAPFYLCMGDIFHETRRSGRINILGRTGFHYPRFLSCKNIRWQGDYNEDTLIDTRTGEVFANENNTYFLKNKFWHATHLRRSNNDDNDYSSGVSRSIKRRETYFILGRRISEAVPAAFGLHLIGLKLPFGVSVKNFFDILFARILKK